jgi:hypothetical protein
MKPALYPTHLGYNGPGSLDRHAFPEQRALGILVGLAFREQIHDAPREAHGLFRTRSTSEQIPPPAHSHLRIRHRAGAVDRLTLPPAARPQTLSRKKTSSARTS